MTGLYILLGLLILFSWILYQPLLAEFSFSKDTEKQSFLLKLRWGPIPIRFENKQDKQKKKKEKKEKSFTREKFSQYLRIYQAIEDTVAEFLHYFSNYALSVQTLSFRLIYGFENPAITGMMTGAVYGFYYNLLALIDRTIKLEACETDIQPDFNKPAFLLDATCIFKVRTVHIIPIAVKALRILKKIKQEQKNINSEQERNEVL